jgi:hypothetical protein
MRCVQVLSVLALRRLLRYACQPVGSNGSALSGDWIPSSHHVARALRQANARAWVALEALLAGEPLWERAQLTWERQLEEEFFQPIRRLLDEVDLGIIDEKGADARRKAGQALQAALASALLTSGGLELSELLSEVDDDAGALDEVQAEWQALERLISQLEEAGYAELGWLFRLRCESGEPLLVVLVAALFRQAVEADPDLFGNLGAACTENGFEGILEDFRALAVLLDKHRSRLDALLRLVIEPVVTGTAPAPMPAGASLSLSAATTIRRSANTPRHFSSIHPPHRHSYSAPTPSV